MIDGKLVLAVVPARGGSKGITLKNLRTVAGVPMVARVGECVQAVPEIDCAVVSTDHEKIAAVAEAAGLAAPDRGDRYVTFQRFAKRLGLETQESEQLARAYGQRCEECIACCPEIPAAEAVLVTLRAFGMGIYINSAMPEVDLGVVLRRRGWSHLVDGVYGAPRSKLEYLSSIMDSADCCAAETMMIGDGKDDLAAARAAGCRFGGVGTRLVQCRDFEVISLLALSDLPEVITRDLNESGRIGINVG